MAGDTDETESQVWLTVLIVRVPSIKILIFFAQHRPER